MATLLLRLAAPMQSWGVDSKFETRQTLREPTKSGVLGLLAAALGCRRDQLPGALLELKMAVRVDQEGRMITDFQTAHGIAADEMGRILRQPDGKRRPARNRDFVTTRQYLCDAVFVVALEHEDEQWLGELADALRTPAYPLFLGRRSCPPTLPLVLGITAKDRRSALNACPWQAAEHYRRKHGTQLLRVLADAEPGSAARPSRRDVPVSFDPGCRRHAMRAIEQYTMTPPGEHEHDPMSELS